MRAGLVTGKAQLELVEFPEPEPAPGKAVVEIAYCGICGTDLHAYQSGAPYNPAICGHEWSGTVSAAAADVAVREGDRVAIGIAGACGQCATCQRGDPEHCETAFAGMIGVGPLAAPHGGFASAIAIDASRLYEVHDHIGDAQAAMLEPATIALHAVRRTSIRLGDVVVVIGGGPIGLLVGQCARAAGAGLLILIEPQSSRRELGSRVGFDVVVDPATEPADAIIASKSGRPGADLVFECAGIPQTVETAVELARRGGVVSLVGVPNAPSSINAAGWLIREIRLTTSLGYLREEFELTQALVADGRLQLDPLHTSTVSLADTADAFSRLASSPEEVKILVDPRI
jgi:(R,R)-butanediol dehydrogenase/meso-butanediol dehydrogenase/diacetyl reductase